LKVVIDTNILLSSLKRTAKNRPIFDAIRTGIVEIAVTTEILLEYVEIIGSRTTAEIGRNVSQLLLNLPGTQKVDVKFRFNLIKSDPDDNKFVDCAIVSNAEMIITNDKHFDELKSIDFPKVEVIRASQFLEILSSLHR
jgi:putative PIN family toxin of toxin-antitoxin system